MVGAGEIVGIVGSAHGAGQRRNGFKRPAVDLIELVIGHGILRGVKIADVAEHEPRGVAHLAVGFGQLAEDLLAGAHIHGVIARSNPEADDIGAVIADDLGRFHAVAGRFVHLLALRVHNPAVAEHALVGGDALGRDAGQKA